MKLFAIIYIKGHLAAAMFLWPGATALDCQRINNEYSQFLDKHWVEKHLDQSPVMVDPYDKKSHLKRSDVALTCEWHAQNPVRK